MTWGKFGFKRGQTRNFGAKYFNLYTKLINVVLFLMSAVYDIFKVSANRTC